MPTPEHDAGKQAESLVEKRADLAAKPGSGAGENQPDNQSETGSTEPAEDPE